MVGTSVKPRPIRTTLTFEEPDSNDTDKVLDDQKVVWLQRKRSWFVCSLILIYSISLSWCYSSLVPVPEVNDSESSRFMESSALAITKALSDGIGHRYVSTLKEDESAGFLERTLERLQGLENMRKDVSVEVVREQVVGANGLQEAFGFEIANVYNNLTNVLLVIRPMNDTRKPSLLINAHYDSTLGSPGASDCASCVGVGYEVARTILSNASIPIECPLIFLFNGGEETLMQASHGFMKTSEYAKNVGAFINIESTGPWGPDVLFQHTDDWTLRAYARVVPFPRGNSVAQDFFEMGVIPADTDYRMLKRREEESVPGIDIAFLFDGLAYHTKEDTVGRIRPGTLQSMGENVLAAVVEFSKVLGIPGYKERMYPDISAVHSTMHGQVFFDVASKFMVVYPAQLATILHNLPLISLLSLSLCSKISEPRIMVKHMRKAGESMILGVALPVALGSVRALMTGRPISWYGNILESCLVYLPISFAGLLLPMGITEGALGVSQGFAALFSLIASVFMMFGMTSSYVSASWGAATLCAVLLTERMKTSHYPNAFGCLIHVLCYAVPSYFGCGVAVTTLMHVVEKIGVAGGADGILGLFVVDAVVGALSGISLILAIGSLIPVFSFALGRLKKPFCKWLIALSLLSAIISSFISMEMSLRRKSGIPYTKECPKRMIVQHIHRVDHDGEIEESYISACSMDAIPMSQPGILPPRLESLESRPFNAHDWVSFYPLNFLVTGVTMQDTMSYNYTKKDIPTVNRASFFSVAVESLKQYLNDGYEAMKIAWSQASLTPKSRSLKRQYFELDTIHPGWAVLNITADIVNWSLGNEIASVRGSPREHIVRYASGPYTTKWQFWMDVPKHDSEVNIQLYVKHFTLVPHVSRMVEEFEDWTSPVGLTTWQRNYTFT